MKHFLKSLFCICLLFTAIVSAAYAQQTLYLTELGNIPLIPQASLVENSSVVFDKPSGRIAEVQLVSSLAVDEIMVYYAKTLPPLGWNRLSQNQFERENEVLIFEAQREGSESVVLIRLIPKERQE